MSRTAARLLLTALPAAALLYAGDFWETSDYENWSTAEVEQILYDSPWAKAGDVDAAGSEGQGGFGLPGGSSSGGVGFPGGGGRSTGGISLPNGGWGVPLASSYNEYDGLDAEVTIRWNSALPVQQALVRATDGMAPQVEDEMLHRAPDYYIIELTSLPLSGAWLAEEPERLRQSSRLIRKGKPTIRASRIEIIPHPGAPGAIVYFPRDEQIMLDDKAVLFEMTPGEVNVKAKFKLKEMLFHGQLEL